MKLGIGISLMNSRTVYGSLDPNAQAFITAAGITDPTIISAVNFLFLSLKGIDTSYNPTGENIYAKQFADYLFVGGSASTNKWNAMNPVDSDAAHRITYSGGLTHNSNGITGGGVNGSANIHITPSDLGQNTGGYFCYTGSPAAGTTNPLFRVMGSGALFESYPRYSGLDRFYFSLNAAESNIGSVTDGLGGRLVTRTGSGAGTTNVWIRTVKTISGNASATPSTLEINLFTTNNNGVLSGFSNHNERRLTFFNQSLTDAEALAFIAINTQFQTMLSRNV